MFSSKGGRLVQPSAFSITMKKKKSARGGSAFGGKIKMPEKFSDEPKGLVICYLGAGKGKTTAAVGMAARAAGAGMNVYILQFVKAASQSAEKITEGEWPVSSEIDFFDFLERKLGSSWGNNNLSRPFGAPSPRFGDGKKERTSFSLLVHLKMTGQFIFEDKKLRAKTGGKYRLFNKPNTPKVLLPSKHTHVIFYFSDGSKLYFNDIRKFGYLKLVRGNELDQVKELKEYGPEPLDKKFTIGAFCSAAQKSPHGKIKEVLMNPKIVAGIGNIYSDEILFHAKVRPERKVASIKQQELRKIYQNIKLVLKKAIAAKGSSVGDFVRTDGSWGQMGKFHFVYGRKGQKCKKCGTIIQSVKLGGRTASFCPRCQK